MKRAHVWVHGTVQGVFFRDFTVRNARKLGLVGWVRNLSNDSVEVVAEGAEENLKKLFEALKSGPQNADVTDIEIKWEEPTGEFESFERTATV